MIELLVGLISALIILAFLITPIIFIVWLVIRSTNGKNNSNRRQSSSYYQPSQYKTGWRWNERKKLWEPPGDFKIQQTQEQNTQTETENKNNDLNYRNAYQSRKLFTINEWQNYKKLREIASIKRYVICPKVRLLDIIEPRKGISNYMTYFGKIKSKHVDFVICDQDMYIKAIIELDDSSHDRPDRKERDEFVDLILRSVGYKVIHTKYVTEDILDLV